MTILHTPRPNGADDSVSCISSGLITPKLAYSRTTRVAPLPRYHQPVASDFPLGELSSLSPPFPRQLTSTLAFLRLPFSVFCQNPSTQLHSESARRSLKVLEPLVSRSTKVAISFLARARAPFSALVPPRPRRRKKKKKKRRHRGRVSVVSRRRKREAIRAPLLFPSSHLSLALCASSATESRTQVVRPAKGQPLPLGVRSRFALRELTVPLRLREPSRASTAPIASLFLCFEWHR